MLTEQHHATAIHWVPDNLHQEQEMTPHTLKQATESTPLASSKRHTLPPSFVLLHAIQHSPMLLFDKIEPQQSEQAALAMIVRNYARGRYRPYSTSWDFARPKAK